MRFKSSSIIVLLILLTCNTAFGTNGNPIPNGSNKTLEVAKDTLRKELKVHADGLAKLALFSLSDKSDIFYSNAPIYVAEHANKETTMLILGTVKFDNDAEITQNGETALTGDFHSLKDAQVVSSTVKPLFLTGNKGIIKFIGENNKQEIVRLQKDGANYKPALSVGLAASKSLAQNFMSFPTIKVEKETFTALAPLLALTGYNPNEKGFVSVNPNVAMSVDELDILDGNRFSVGVSTDGLLKVAAGSAATAEDYYKTNSAYVDFRVVKEAAANQHPGYSEVNMKMYDYDATQPNAQIDTKVTTTNTVQITGGTKATFLRGITSPFDHLYADYMFYHVLTEPNARSITSNVGPISSPDHRLLPGKGYFYAMDLSREYFKDIEDRWHGIIEGAPNASGLLKPSDYRSRGGYNFSRLINEYTYSKHNNAQEGLSRFNRYSSFTDSKLVAHHKIHQKFNVVTDVKVEIVGPGGSGLGNKDVGLNYLANPFMTPINLKGLLAVTESDGTHTLPTTDADFDTPFEIRGIKGAKAVHRLTNAAVADAQLNKYALLRARYWVVNTALVANLTINGTPAYGYNVKYDIVDPVDSSPTVTDPFNSYLEPMQMFLVQAQVGGNIEFTNDIKAYEGHPFAIKLAAFGEYVPAPPASRMASPSASVEPEILSDWFIMQAESEKAGVMSVDRTAVRFFNGATIGFENKHDVEKQLAFEKRVASTTRSDESQFIDETASPQNVIYTVTPNRVPLLANGIGYGTKEVPLYYLPNNENGEAEKVTFKAIGIDGFDKIQGVWLIDRFKNVKQRLEEGTEYSFESMPAKETMDGENRFILRFYDDEDDIILNENPINSFYSGSTLHIVNLIEKDLGSLVQIYDLQGRLMGSTTVNNYPTMEYHKTLGQGTFIVRITGERNYTSKFVNLQNY